MNEEDIEILEEKMNKELNFLIENANKTEQLTAISIIAMKEPVILLFLSILSDYKRVLEMNEVLLKENEELKNQEATARKINELLVQRYSNSIPIQKVKDKIEKLNKKEKEELKGLKGQDRYFVKQIYQNKRIILQELIEEREEE